MNEQPITLALSKGRIFEEALPLLADVGIVPEQGALSGRKLLIQTNRPDVRLLFVRASDVATYVRHGAAHLGIAGRDTMLEDGSAGLLQPLNLNIAQCRMAVAAAEKFDYPRAITARKRLKVATKYVQLANTFFSQKGVPVDIIKLYGSMELAPITGLADVIVDLVSTGATLQSNGLVECEQIMAISSVLIVNHASMKLRRNEINKLIQQLKQAVTTAKKTPL